MKNILKILRLVLVFALVFSLFTVGCKKKTSDLNGESGGKTESESGTKESQTENESGTKESQTESGETPKGELAFTLNEDGQSYSVSGIGSFTGKEIIIPSTYEGLEVTEIYPNSFHNNEKIVKVVIPNSVKKIGEKAFWACANIESVDFGSGVEEIGVDSFSSCNSLNFIKIPNSVKIICEGAFKLCQNLAVVEIGDSVTSIGRLAFGNCKNLVKVVLGSSVQTIARNGFFASNKLVEVYNKSSLNIEKGSTDNGSLGYYAMNIYTPPNGESKVSVTDNGCVLFSDGGRVVLMAYVGKEDNFAIPNGVTETFKNAVYREISSVVIPKTLTKISGGIFCLSESISAVYYCGNSEEWKRVEIEDENGQNYNLTQANRYYYSETKPTEEGNFWYYGKNGNVLIW